MTGPVKEELSTGSSGAESTLTTLRNSPHTRPGPEVLASASGVMVGILSRPAMLASP